jgi:hypothetical protein
MSYDVSIGEWERNYTWNSLSPLCFDLLHDDGLRCLHGLCGAEALPLLAAFWHRLNELRVDTWRGNSIGEPALCAKYDSPNGWGSLVGAMIFMAELTAACGQYPDSLIEVDA